MVAERAGGPDPGWIDVHAHFVPDDYRAAAVAAGHERPDGMPGIPAWSAADALQTMDRLGVQSALLSVSSPGVHFGDDRAARALAQRVNEAGARLVDDHRGRFGLFASLPLPDVDGTLAEIRRAFDELSADGVVMLTNAHGVYPADPRLDPVLAELDRRAAVVFLHPTSPCCACGSAGPLVYPRPMMEFLFETTRAVADLILRGVLDRYRRLRLLVPHAGATLPVLADRLHAFATLTNATGADVLGQLRRLYYDVAGFAVPRQLPALLSVADPQRLMYGSDWPFTPAPLVERLQNELDAYLATASLDGVRRRHAEVLFPRLAQ